ncbi:MAG: hypothetical protein ACKOUK_13800 [Verrucomicrobiota bacterium]
MPRVLPRVLAFIACLAGPALVRAAAPAPVRLNGVFILADELPWGQRGRSAP